MQKRKITKRDINKRIWKPASIRSKKMQLLGDWLNGWGDFNKHKECLDKKYVITVKKQKPVHITEFGRGYEQAVTDVFNKIGFKTKKVLRGGK